MKETAIGRYRYRILAMVFVATTINYLDRSIIGVLAPTLQYKVFNWSDIDYANVMISFKVAYAIGMLVMGNIIDRFGTRMGYVISIVTWTIFGMMRSAIQPAFSLIGFITARFGHGLGEAGNFPAAIKTVAEWFPKKERALAVGLFNTGPNIGSILAPLLVPLIVMADGTNWQLAFFMTAPFSVVWIIIWLRNYNRPENHPTIGKAELEYITSDSIPETQEKVSWLKVLFVRETWGFGCAKFTDAVWWFYLFWGGKFLYEKFGLNIKELALPLITIYVIAMVGSIYGGWLSSHFIKIGWHVNKARKLTLFFCALLTLPVMFVTTLPTSFRVDQHLFEKLERTTYKKMELYHVKGRVKSKKVDALFPKEAIRALKSLEGSNYTTAKEFSVEASKVIGDEFNALEPVLHKNARSNNYYWFGILMIAVAAAAHSAWSANIFTIVSDVFPKKAVASVTGIGGMAGAVAGLLADFSLGQVLTSSGPSGYFFAFMIAGSMYMLLLLVIHILIPGMTPLDENLKRIKV